MDDITESQPQPGSNSPEMTVSELAGALKRTVEENYAFVRVRGELIPALVDVLGPGSVDALARSADLLDDENWVGVDQQTGEMRTTGDNGAFVVAALEQATGDRALSTLRSRGAPSRGSWRAQIVRRCSGNLDC